MPNKRTKENEKKMNSALLAKLPLVKGKEGLELFERAELTFRESGNRILTYVAGREGRYLVHGDILDENNKVHQSGDLVISYTRCDLLKKYRPY